MTDTDKTAQQKRVSFKGLTFKPFIPAQEIHDKVSALAADISRDYAGKTPLIICVLNGAFAFASDLFRALTIDAEITFIRLKSYEGTGSTGEIKQLQALTEDISGRDIIVVEDIIDTGHTMARLVHDLAARKPASIAVATLLYKPEACVADIRPDYVGFAIPPAFIIGYGLDIDGLARNLPDIWVVDPDAGK